MGGGEGFTQMNVTLLGLWVNGEGALVRSTVYTSKVKHQEKNNDVTVSGGTESNLQKSVH